jgi:dienelactone hydrolase
MKKLGFIVMFLMLTLLLGSSLGACIAPSDKLIEFVGPNNSKISALVTVPAGDGPFPAIILAHGSYGFDGPAAVKSYLNVAQRFTSDGFIVIALSYDASVTGVTSGKAMRQISDAIELAKIQPNVKVDKICLWGYSNGGAAVLNVAADNPRLAGVVAIEPYLPRAAGTDKKIAVPVLLVGGDFDTIVPVASLKAYEKSLQSQGKKVESLYGPWQHSYEYYAMTKRAAEFFVKKAGTAATE